MCNRRFDLSSLNVYFVTKLSRLLHLSVLSFRPVFINDFIFFNLFRSDFFFKFVFFSRSKFIARASESLYSLAGLKSI